MNHFGRDSRSWCIVLATLCLLPFASANAQAPRTSPTEILASPERFDGRPVTISGTITNVQERISQAGNPYYTGDLSDGTQSIRVFSFGHASCRGGHATVDGTFKTVTRQGHYTFYNEIAATRVAC
jgi:predicted dienelactone hydrolase